MANACVDADDFMTDSGGRLQLRPHFAQTDQTNFSHVLDGVDGTYEVINELAAVVVPTDGLYVVNWGARGNVVNPSPAIGAIINASVFCGIAINGVFQFSTATMCTSVNQGASTVDQPALGSEGTGSGSKVFALTAGQQIRLHGAMRRSASSVCSILANNDGQCFVSIHRISG